MPLHFVCAAAWTSVHDLAPPGGCSNERGREGAYWGRARQILSFMRELLALPSDLKERADSVKRN